MPTHDRSRALRADQVADVVAGEAFPDWVDAVPPDRVGLEAEFLPVQLGPPSRRLTIDETSALAADALAAIGFVPDTDYGGFRGRDGTRITFEPGGQLEVSTACMDDITSATGLLDQVATTIAGALARGDAGLAAAGADLWHPLEDVPQQLAHARYPAMHAYFSQRSAHGPRMMRHTASLQVNLDGGGAEERRERWTVANLLAPAIAASFANSRGAVDGRDVSSVRAVTWRGLDPTRTGFPSALVSGEADPVAQLVEAALAADVMLVLGSDDGAVPGRPGWTFEAWLHQGDPLHGWPTPDDLRYHLTTLFHEVRARGPLEFRGIDALPATWRAVPVVLLAGALYDPRARSDIRRVLEPRRPRLPELLSTASTVGVADGALCAMSVEVWSYAVEGATRLPRGYARATDIERARAFIDGYTARGRTPGDELAERLSDDPALALRSVLEPLAAQDGARR